MTKKFYYLSSCDTCKRILNELQLPADVQLQDIKKQPLSEADLAAMHPLARSYEALFSKRAQLYKARNLKEANLAEADFKSLLLEQYTFLKRPVLLLGDQIFVGNSKATVAAAKAAF